MQELILPGLLFVAIFCLILAVLRRMLGQRRPAADEDALPGTRAAAVAAHPGRAFPMTARGQADLRQALRRAGYYQQTALWDYALMRAALVLLPLFLGGALALIVPQGQMPMVVVAAVIAAILGFSLPRLYLVWRGRSRAREIEKGLPFAVDLLSLSLSAGQNSLGAFHLVGRELQVSHPVLADELGIVSEQAKLSSVAHALGQLADRAAVPGVHNLALLVDQSEQLGADTATGLLEFSRHQRLNMRQEAEAQANRAGFWMMFPCVVCLWVAASLVMVGPLYIQFCQGWATLDQQTSGNQLSVERAKQAAGPRAPARPAPTLAPTLP